MIWHNGQLYTYEGWTVKLDPYWGWITLRPSRGFPGYVRLRELGTDNVINLRADCVMLNTQPV